MERYSAYKDSGIDWIGEIPEQWNCTPFKHVANATYGFPFDSSRFNNQGNGKPLIRIRDITSGTIETYFDGNYPDYSITRKGDVLVGMDGDFNVRIWDGPEALLNQRCCKVSGKTTMHDKFLAYCLPFALEQINELKYATTVKHLSDGDINNTALPCPSLKAQQSIVNYLDEKTEAIDAAVADIERSIELLNEYRRSVISEAVTKGLDPNAPMKDSGVDWIGQIPAHWEILPLKRCAHFLPGYAFKSEDFKQTDGVRLLRGINVSVGAIRWEDTVYVDPHTVESLEEYRLSQGDILVGLDRPWIQAGMRVAQVDDKSDGSFLVQRVAKVTPNKHQLTSEFLLYLFQTNIFAEAMDSTTTGVSVPHISTGQLGEVVIPCPPLSEQHAIEDGLLERMSSIDSLIQQKQSLVVRLREYKASLISECVTGKIKVPGVEEES